LIIDNQYKTCNQYSSRASSALACSFNIHTDFRELLWWVKLAWPPGAHPADLSLPLLGTMREKI